METGIFVLLERFLVRSRFDGADRLLGERLISVLISFSP